MVELTRRARRRDDLPIVESPPCIRRRRLQFLPVLGLGRTVVSRGFQLTAWMVVPCIRWAWERGRFAAAAAVSRHRTAATHVIGAIRGVLSATRVQSFHQKQCRFQGAGRSPSVVRRASQRLKPSEMVWKSRCEFPEPANYQHLGSGVY